jgi:urea transporter
LGSNSTYVNGIMPLTMFGGPVDEVASIVSPCQNREIVCLARYDINQALVASVWAFLLIVSWALVSSSRLGCMISFIVYASAFQRAMHTWTSFDLCDSF